MLKFWLTTQLNRDFDHLSTLKRSFKKRKKEKNTSWVSKNTVFVG